MKIDLLYNGKKNGIMQRRILAFVCMLTLLVSLLPVNIIAVVSAESTEQQYQVGYSIKNINPWVKSTFNLATDLGSAVFVDPSTANKKIYPSLCSLVGNQVDWKTVIANVFDDNNDGERDEKDGIFVTCTAVTHSKGTEEEKTILFFTMDAMKTYTEIVSDVRKKIVEQYGETYGIAADQIMVSSNHSHSSPQYTSSLGSYIDTATFDTNEKVTKLKADRKTYYNWVIDQMVAAAKESLDDRAAATMTRGSVDATEATAGLGYNNGAGYQMNAIRHYEKTVTSKYFSSQKVSYISSNATPSASKLKEGLQASSNGYNAFAQGSVVTDLSDESDNNMYVLRFEFDSNSGKKPVVFVNWRAHSTMNSGIERTSISSDYANGLRTVLADKGYRAAFFLGAAGNVVAGPTSAVYTDANGKLVPQKMDWLNEATTGSGSSLKVNSAKKTFIYGKMLAEIADYCMDEVNGLMTETLPAGEIKNIQLDWKADKQIYSDEMKTAALDLRKKIEADMAAASYTKGISQFVSDNQSKYFPYRYTDPSTGKVAILNTRLHYNSVYNQAVSTSTATKTSAIELNAIMLGENVAFITSPNELADYYHDFSDIVKEDGTADMLTSAEIEAANDWYNLITESYGMPFVLGYSNQNVGYIANWLDHYSNSQLFSQITGKGKQGHMIYSPGTYESLTSGYAQGQGEELIKFYAKMLDVLNSGYRKSYCEACGETVEWVPILATAGSLPSVTGHYYLYEDMQMGSVGSNRCSIKGDTKICLDLNGHKMETPSRTFYIDGSATVNLFDSVGTGQAISYSGGNNVGGGAVYGSSKSTLNIYGGTLQFIRQERHDGKYETGNGAVIATTGTVNVYGGKLVGGELSMSTYYASNSTSNGCGGTVFLSGSAKLNVYGGQILAGKAADGRYGDCVYLADKKGTVTLYGDAVVDEIYLSNRTDNQIVINGSYTGRAAINVNTTPALGLQLGTLNSGDVTNATLTYSGNSEYAFTVSEDKLVTSAREDNAAAVVMKNYTAATYQDIDTAIQVGANGLVTLLQDVTKDITIDQNTYMDLNGYNVTGTVEVADGSILYCLDSETDDFDVSDGKYGRLTAIEGTVLGVPESDQMTKDGYLMVTEQDGTSFHRVDLRLTAMSLRAENAGLYYKSSFSGDEVVARYVDRYGVALSLKDEPTVENLDTDCAYSWFDDFVAGSNSGSSTILKDVMRTSNSNELNSEYAHMPIYGRAYIKFNDGSYMFGASASRSLRQQLEDTNDILTSYSTTQRKAAAAMCQTYFDVVKAWGVEAILAYGASSDGILKIFAIGDDYTVDSMHLLHEVYKAEKPTQKVILGYACRSESTLAQHVESMNSGEALYTYYEVAVDGTQTISCNKTLEELVMDENWDVVTIQQGSSESGLEATYNTDIKKLRDYVIACHGYTPKFAWNMTWSYPERVDANAGGWDQYGSQEKMFESIVTAVKNKIATDTAFNYLIPVGLAVQNARTYYTVQGDLHRDGYGYLNDFSRLLAAYMWYCELQGTTLKTVKLETIPAALTNTYTDGDLVLTDVQKQVLMQCVNGARARKKDGTFTVTQFTLP